MHTKNSSLSHEFDQCKNCFVHLLTNIQKTQTKTTPPRKEKKPKNPNLKQRNKQNRVNEKSGCSVVCWKGNEDDMEQTGFLSSWFEWKKLFMPWLLFYCPCCMKWHKNLSESPEFSASPWLPIYSPSIKSDSM